MIRSSQIGISLKQAPRKTTHVRTHARTQLNRSTVYSRTTQKALFKEGQAGRGRIEFGGGGKLCRLCHIAMFFFYHKRRSGIILLNRGILFLKQTACSNKKQKSEARAQGDDRGKAKETASSTRLLEHALCSKERTCSERQYAVAVALCKRNVDGRGIMQKKKQSRT